MKLSYFYFDRIRINVKLPLYKLKKLIPLEDLEPYCRTITMNYASGIARKYRFDSKIEILAVKDKELFRILSQYEQDLLGYKISYLEIAGDTSCSGKDESIVASELLMKSAVKTYTSTGTLFDVARQSKKRISLLRGKVDKEIFSGRTLYLGGETFQICYLSTPVKINWKSKRSSRVSNSRVFKH